MTKPKGKTPSLLVQSTGKPSAYTCKRKTDCSRCKEVIIKGEECFRIPKQELGYTSQKLYCSSCFGLIIAQTKDDLLMLEKLLNEQNGGA